MYKSTQLILDDHEYIYTIKNMDIAARAEYIRVRNFGLSQNGSVKVMLFYMSGLPIEGLGKVWTGINIRTMEPCTVKKLMVKNAECRDNTLAGLLML